MLNWEFTKNDVTIQSKARANKTNEKNGIAIEFGKPMD